MVASLDSLVGPDRRAEGSEDARGGGGGVHPYLGSGLGWGEPFGSRSGRGYGWGDFFSVQHEGPGRSVINKSPRVGWAVPL